MKKKNETDSLNEAIILLQKKQEQELQSLKEQFHLTYESFKPINLIKSTLQEISSSPEVKSSILGSTIGITTGYLAKKVIFGASHNPLKILFGTVMQFALANIISKHSDDIKLIGKNLLNRFLQHRKELKKRNSP